MSRRIDFLLYRTLGNDLPPRHDGRQTLGNLRFILEHEHLPAGVERRWILNRIADAAMEHELSSLIEAQGEKHVRIPFDPAVYALRFIDASRTQPLSSPPVHGLAGEGSVPAAFNADASSTTSSATPSGMVIPSIWARRRLTINTPRVGTRGASVIGATPFARIS